MDNKIQKKKMSSAIKMSIVHTTGTANVLRLPP